MSQPLYSRPSTVCMRGLFAAASLASACLFAPHAQAGVIYSPATIVDHGSYITDTANQLDWYKFSNPVNTVGYSANAWAAANLLSGWSVASATQVQSLETQFGWSGDSDAVGDLPNLGITYAMGAYLGFTAEVVYYLTDSTVHAKIIEAQTSDTYYYDFDANGNNGKTVRQVTTARTYKYDSNDGGVYVQGDEIDATYRLAGLDDTDTGTGIWLSRASIIGGGGGGAACGRLAPCPPPAVDVPEPGTGWLFLIATAVLIGARSRFYPRQA